MMYEFIKQNQIYFISILSLVVFALSIYLGFLVKKVRVQNVRHQTLLDEHKANAQETAEYYKESILIISKATIQGQCEISEACIRIKKLLEFFPSIAEDTKFKVITTLFNELEEFDYLDERKTLSAQEKFHQDTKRFQVEEKFNNEFIKNLKLLVEQFESMH